MQLACLPHFKIRVKYFTAAVGQRLIAKSLGPMPFCHIIIWCQYFDMFTCLYSFIHLLFCPYMLMFVLLCVQTESYISYCTSRKYT